MNFAVHLQGINLVYWLTMQYELVYQAIAGSVRNLVSGLAGRLPYIIAAVIVLLLFWFASKFFRWLFLSSTRKGRIDTQLRILVSRLIAVFMFVIGVFTALSVVIESFDFGQVIAGLGFTSFVVGFATKDILNNFLSGILILWQRPFNIGDYLFVGSNQGKVEHIGVRATMLRKDDGEAVLIPNGEMYSSALTIRGKGEKRRMSLKFNLGFDADLDLAKQIVLETVSKIEGVVRDPQPNVYVTEFAEEGVVLTLQFWIDTNENRPLRVFDQVSVEVLRSLNAAAERIHSTAVKVAEIKVTEGI